jgi:O-6-methylguanine DNA methyltransferase
MPTYTSFQKADLAGLTPFEMPSRLGTVCGLSSRHGFCFLTFGSWEQVLSSVSNAERRRLEPLLASLVSIDGFGRCEQEPLASWMSALQRYLARQTVDLPIPVDFRLCSSPFQKRVLAEMAKVGPGQTTTYGDLAHAVGRPTAARAVGRAVGSNPVALVLPCHRVLGKNGHLHGFAFGLDLKATLLGMEGLSIGENGKLAAVALKNITEACQGTAL